MGIRDLVKVANRLDNLGLNSEADALDRIIRKIAEEPQGMVAPGGYGSTAVFDPGAIGTARTADEQAEKERYADYRGLLPTARKIFVPRNFQGDEASFKQSFTGGWNAYPDNPTTKADWESWNVTKERWSGWAEALADILWKEKQNAAAAPPTPTPAPKPAPKRPMTDDQRWAAYAGRVPGGDAVKVMWTKSGAGKALTGSETFDSFKEWMKSMMAATGMTSISAVQLVGKLSDFKAAALADTANGRNISSQGSLLKKLYDTVTKDPVEYKRIVSALGAKARAEGTMRESEQVGREAVEAVYSDK